MGCHLRIQEGDGWSCNRVVYICKQHSVPLLPVYSSYSLSNPSGAKFTCCTSLHSDPDNSHVCVRGASLYLGMSTAACCTRLPSSPLFEEAQGLAAPLLRQEGDHRVVAAQARGAIHNDVLGPPGRCSGSESVVCPCSVCGDPVEKLGT
jgi:hypothetical protein